MNCEIHLFKDTLAIDSDLFAKYSFYKRFSRNTEEKNKEIFGLEYEAIKADYDKSRSELESLEDIVQENSLVKATENYYQRYLSAESLKAYSLCIMQQGNLPVCSWFENIGDDTFAIRIQAGNLLDIEGSITVISGKDNDQKNITFSLKRGSEQINVFNYSHAHDVDIIISCEAENGVTAATYMYLPRVVSFKQHIEPGKELSVRTQIWAGGQGGSSSTAPHYDPITFIADHGYYLDQASVRQVAVEQGSPPMRNWEKRSNPEPDAIGKFKIIDISLYDLDGTSGKTQSRAWLTFSVNQYKIVTTIE